jgi:hypothetical protein
VRRVSKMKNPAMSGSSPLRVRRIPLKTVTSTNMYLCELNTLWKTIARYGIPGEVKNVKRVGSKSSMLAELYIYRSCNEGTRVRISWAIRRGNH